MGYSQWGCSIDLSISHLSLCYWEYSSEYFVYQPGDLLTGFGLLQYQGEGDWMGFLKNLEPFPVSRPNGGIGVQQVTTINHSSRQ